MTTSPKQDHDDALITAYALGELSGSQRDEIERLLASGTPAAAAAQREIARIRDFSALIARDLLAEVEVGPLPVLSDKQRAAIARAARPRVIVGWRTLAALASAGLAAGVLILLGLPGDAPPAASTASSAVAKSAEGDERLDAVNQLHERQLSERQKDLSLQVQAASAQPAINEALRAAEKKTARRAELEQATDQLADRKRVLALGGKPGAATPASPAPQDAAERSAVALAEPAPAVPASSSVAAPFAQAAGAPLARADGRAKGALTASAAPTVPAAAAALPPVSAPFAAAPALAAAVRPAAAAAPAPMLSGKAPARPVAHADKAAAAGPPAAAAGQGGELKELASAGPPTQQDGTPVLAAGMPVSGIPIPHGNAAIATLRRCLDAGTLPPAALVDLPQLISAWSGPLAGPLGDAPAAMTISVGDCPWDASHQLARIAVRTRAAAPSAPPAEQIVLVIDASAAMAGDERLPLIQRGAEHLLTQLRGGDQVAVVVAADQVRVLDAGSGIGQRARLRAGIAALAAGGSARIADGIELATRIAHDHLLPLGVNQVILCSAGQGMAGSAVALAAQPLAQDGISLSVMAVGHDHPEQGVLEGLAAKGHGRFAYITTAAAAEQQFAALLALPPLVVVRDAVLQLAINPARVASYHVLGDSSAEPGAMVAGGASPAGAAAALRPDVLTADQQLVALVELVPVGSPEAVAREANKTDEPARLEAQGVELISVTLRGLDSAGTPIAPLVARFAGAVEHGFGAEAPSISRGSAGHTAAAGSASVAGSAAVADFALALSHPRESQGLWPRILGEARAASRGGLAGGEELVELVTRASQLSSGAHMP
jgi:hypothetical protein